MQNGRDKGGGESLGLTCDGAPVHHSLDRAEKVTRHPYLSELGGGAASRLAPHYTRWTMPWCCPRQRGRRARRESQRAGSRSRGRSQPPPSSPVRSSMAWPRKKPNLKKDPLPLYDFSIPPCRLAGTRWAARQSPRAGTSIREPPTQRARTQRAAATLRQSPPSRSGGELPPRACVSPGLRPWRIGGILAEGSDGGRGECGREARHEVASQRATGGGGQFMPYAREPPSFPPSPPGTGGNISSFPPPSAFSYGVGGEVWGAAVGAAGATGEEGRGGWLTVSVAEGSLGGAPRAGWSHGRGRPSAPGGSRRERANLPVVNRRLSVHHSASRVHSALRGRHHPSSRGPGAGGGSEAARLGQRGHPRRAGE